MTINEIQDDIIEQFTELDDWMDRYAMLIEWGETLEPLDEKSKTPQNLIEGCQSRVWITGNYSAGVLDLSADSDALITKGIAALLLKVLSGQPAHEIASCDLYMIDKIGLREHLSPTRSNGLFSMIQRIRAMASSCAS